MHYRSKAQIQSKHTGYHIIFFIFKRIIIIDIILVQEKLYSIRIFLHCFFLEFWKDNPCADSTSLIASLMTSIAADLFVPVNPTVVEYIIAGCFQVPQGQTTDCPTKCPQTAKNGGSRNSGGMLLAEKTFSNVSPVLKSNTSLTNILSS